MSRPTPHGFASVGARTVVDPSVRIFGGECVRVGADSRIDCFAVITAGPGLVEIGDFTHLAAGCMIFGTGGVSIDDGAGISGRVMIYSATDHPASGHLLGPQVPRHLRDVHAAPVVVESHVMVGAGSVVMPGVRLGYGSAVGALSFVREDVEPNTIVAGSPARVVGTRDPDQLARCVAEFDAMRSRAQGA